MMWQTLSIYRLKKIAVAVILIFIFRGTAFCQTEVTNVWNGKIYKIEINGGGRLHFVKAKYSLFIPEECNRVAAIFIHQHGCTMEGTGEPIVTDIQYQAFAKKWNVAVLAPDMTPHQKNCMEWSDPDNGSEAALFTALDSLADKSGHQEIKNAPWLLWGHSGGGNWVLSMLNKHPDRVMALVGYSAAFDIRYNYPPGAYKVPVLLRHAGDDDYEKCWLTAVNNFSKLRNGDGLVSIAHNLHQTHNFSYIRYVSLAFFEAVLKQRLAEAGKEMKDMDRKREWLGDTAVINGVFNIYKGATYRDDKTALSWLPDSLFALKYREYVLSGTIQDNTAPPSPYDATLHLQSGNCVIQWKADADIESGIKCFTIYRNGKFLMRYPETEDFQRFDLNGDNPIPVSPPEMRITVSGIKISASDLLEITTVNRQGLESSRTVIITQPRASVQYYIGPNGNDENTGSSPAEAFATIERALGRIDNMQDDIARAGDSVHIYLIGGVYMLKKPIIIQPATTAFSGPQVIIENYKGSEVIMTGGQKITGWKKRANGVWVARLPGTKSRRWDFDQLFVNGQRRCRAKSPNNGFYRVAGFPDGDTSVYYYTPGRRFQYKPGDLNPHWRNLTDVEVIVYHFWTDSHLPIQSIDDKKHIVTFQNNAGKVFTDDFTRNGARYIVDNVFEGLDAPGEWYLDKRTDELFYMPMPGEDMNKADIWVPVISGLLHLEGDPLRQRYVRNIHFKGITFQCSKDTLSKGDANDAQGATGVSASIFIKGARNCSFENCIIRNIGGYAFKISDGCAYNNFRNNVIEHIGAGGFMVNGGDENDSPLLRTGHNIFTDNVVRYYGERYASGVGVLLQNTFDNLVSHNKIAHGFYTGVSVGWHWGYGRTVSWGNIISFNHIHDIGQGLLSDMGAIYTLGDSPGTIIENNLIHDVQSHNYGGWGIYNDEGSAHLLIQNNIVYNTKFAGYNIHYAKEITVRNNIFALGDSQQLSRTRAEPHKSVFFENNIVYWKSGVLFDGHWKDKTTSTFDADWNLYFNPGKPLNAVLFNGYSWPEWQQSGKDRHSLYTDPLFVDAEKYDFRLQADSPVFRLGFQNINMDNVGPRSPI